MMSTNDLAILPAFPRPFQKWASLQCRCGQRCHDPAELHIPGGWCWAHFRVHIHHRISCALHILVASSHIGRIAYGIRLLKAGITIHMGRRCYVSMLGISTLVNLILRMRESFTGESIRLFAQNSVLPSRINF